MITCASTTMTSGKYNAIDNRFMLMCATLPFYSSNHHFPATIPMPAARTATNPKINIPPYCTASINATVIIVVLLRGILLAAFTSSGALNCAYSNIFLHRPCHSGSSSTGRLQPIGMQNFIAVCLKWN